MARSAIMSLRAFSAPILSFGADAFAASAAAVAAAICARRDVSLSGSILWNVALVLIILTSFY